MSANDPNAVAGSNFYIILRVYHRVDKINDEDFYYFFFP